MNSYAYEAVDGSGLSVKGVIDVATQSQALRRIKEMGLFPTRVREKPHPAKRLLLRRRAAALLLAKGAAASVRLGRRVTPRALTVFTRQLGTLLEAGMPLLRGLRILEEQAHEHEFKRVVGEVCTAIEEGDALSEALAVHPKVFGPLYVNMVRAGEASGALDVVLLRLACFQEKYQRTKGKVLAGMFYPVAVLLVAIGILTALMIFVIPRFKEVFDGLLGGAPMPAFTVFVLNLGDLVRHQAPMMILILAAMAGVVAAGLRTRVGRRVFDELKLKGPVVGEVFRKAAVARFSRTLGTLLGSGVPILQALAIARETAGNGVVARVVLSVQERVKQGDPIAPTLKASKVFPAIVAGMVDVGEQTGALPDMLLKIADNYDEEVDNAVTAMTSLLEPVMIILLAIMVGSIVIALFLPIISFAEST